MATVLAMRINEQQALLVADESTWHLGHVFGYRRTNYGDSLASLFDPDETERTGLSAVYGGVGFPSFHGEVVDRARKALKGRSGKDAGGERGANRVVAKTVYEAFLANHERLVDDNLRFCYGFGRDELNARSYRTEGGRGPSAEIKMDPVVGAARTVATGSASGNAYARIFSNWSFVLTRDRVNGVQGWYIGPRGHSVAFATPIATLGEGGDVASHLLSHFLQRRDLMERREGFELRDGVYIGMKLATAMRFSTGKMGGYFQILLVDGDRGVRSYQTDETYLAAEVMRAHEWGFLSRGDAQELVCALLLEGEGLEPVERELFSRCGDPTLLRRYLMGFKPAATPAALAVDPPAAATKGGDGR